MRQGNSGRLRRVEEVAAWGKLGQRGNARPDSEEESKWTLVLKFQTNLDFGKIL
jgi:hypothetical protein